MKFAQAIIAVAFFFTIIGLAYGCATLRYEECRDVGFSKFYCAKEFVN